MGSQVTVALAFWTGAWYECFVTYKRLFVTKFRPIGDNYAAPVRCHGSVTQADHSAGQITPKERFA